MPEHTALSKITLLHDQPIPSNYQEADDGLGFHAYAKILAGAALGTPGPFTIGVFGEWGTGKTSLLHMVKGLLDAQEEESVVTVWFDAWLHEQDDHPLVPLVATILQVLESHETALSRLRDGGKNLLNALFALAQGFSVKVKRPDLDALELELGVSVTDAREALDRLKEDPLLKQSLHAQAFSKLSDLHLRDKLKIVVLIDDLDRCMPDRAIKLLESIKLVLSQPGFIFMLGVSRRVIQGYLEHRYEKEYGISDFRGAAYLDKIVQLPFPIPPHSGRMQDFSSSLLKRLHRTDQQALKGVLPLIGVACNNNPRATVRFVNNLLVDRAINLALAQKGDMKVIGLTFFAITRALQHRWPRMLDLLERTPKLCESLAIMGRRDPREAEFEEGSVQYEVHSRLAEPELQALLLSDHGKMWLGDSQTRTATSQFLLTQRSEPAASSRALLSILVVCAGEDFEAGQSITRILRSHSYDVELLISSQNVYSTVTAAVVWVVGSDWEEYQNDLPLHRILKRWASSPLFLVLLPQADESSVPSKVAAELAMLISDYPVEEEDLQPLIRALALQPWQRPALDRLAVQVGDAVDVHG